MVQQSDRRDTDESTRKVLRIMSILGGIVWMVNTYVIYKIPAPDLTIPDPGRNNHHTI
jgi:hypothetical protein